MGGGKEVCVRGRIIFGDYCGHQQISDIFNIDLRASATSLGTSDCQMVANLSFSQKGAGSLYLTLGARVVYRFLLR